MANGATMDNHKNGDGPYECWKEIGQTYVEESEDEWENCLLKPGLNLMLDLF